MDSTNPQSDTATAQSPPPIPYPKQPSTKTRRRARKACLSCRARKVRCDVSHRGRPCTNCYLDSGHCVVTGRSSKYRRGALHDSRDGTRAPSPTNEPNFPETQGNREPTVPSDSTQGEGCVGPQGQPVADASASLSPRIVDQNNNRGNAFSHDEPMVPLTVLLLNEALAPPFEARDCQDSPVSFREPYISLMSIRDHRPTADTSSRSSEISFYYYPFLRITNLHQLPQHDAVYLESQGCFKIPIRPFLDEIVRQYFLHIHPFLPLLNEGDFWKSYYYDPHYPSEGTISVLLLHAMIFASCTFVPEHTSHALGYRDVRSMRATFLRRARSLYSLECESSPVTIAQACVLLSFTSLSSSRTPNTYWLSVAIENAKLAEGHTYSAIGSQSHTKQQNILKRLWWCCIIRDRSMSLLMRLPIHITKDQFDFNDLLTSEDLEDELQRSEVYDPMTKLRLAEILFLSIKLHKTLTDILLLVIPGKWMQCSFPQDEHRARHRVQDCKTSLEAWHASATSKLQSTQTDHDLQEPTDSHQSDGRASIILYTNLMYMYYHTARIALCHYEALHLVLVRTSPGPCYSFAEDLSTIYETKHELQDAVSGLASCHEELLQQGLVQWLPSSAIGFIFLPLVLNILETKLLPPPGIELDWRQAAGTAQQQLNILIQLVRVYRQRYDGIEWASEIIRHTIDLARLDEIKAQRRNSSTTMNWVDIFAFQPRTYLRLVLALDLSLRTGQLPQDWDFPAKLRGLFTLVTNPLKAFIEGRCISQGLESETFPSPRLQPMDPELSQAVENHNIPYYALGLDECLIASLEGPFTFSEYMGPPDIADAGTQGDADSLLDHPGHPEGSSRTRLSSTELNTNKKSIGHHSRVTGGQNTFDREAGAENGEGVPDCCFELL